MELPASCTGNPADSAFLSHHPCCVGFLVRQISKKHQVLASHFSNLTCSPKKTGIGLFAEPVIGIDTSIHLLGEFYITYLSFVETTRRPRSKLNKEFQVISEYRIFLQHTPGEEIVSYNLYSGGCVCKCHFITAFSNLI